MPEMLIRLQVADYAIWKRRFDDDAAVRRANGCQAVRLFRNAADPREVVILCAWDDLDRARLFAQSDDLQVLWVRAGVTDRPDVWILEDVGTTT